MSPRSFVLVPFAAAAILLEGCGADGRELHPLPDDASRDAPVDAPAADASEETAADAAEEAASDAAGDTAEDAEAGGVADASG